jgi:hypothetical protein
MFSGFSFHNSHSFHILVQLYDHFETDYSLVTVQNNGVSVGCSINFPPTHLPPSPQESLDTSNTAHIPDHDSNSACAK